MAQNDPTKIFEKHYNEWMSNPERLKSGYDYERTYAEMMKKVEKEIFQNSVGEIPINKNKKKTPNHLWKNKYCKRSYYSSRPINIWHKQLCTTNDVLCWTTSCV